MTVNEFNELILKDTELQKKYDAEKEALSKDGIKDRYELSSKAAAKIGFDVPASEFQLGKITKKVLNENELEAVAGGKCGVDCKNDFEDTDCWSNDFCQTYNNSYVLKTCLYTHDGYCTCEDGCYVLNQHYDCNGNFTYNV